MSPMPPVTNAITYNYVIIIICLHSFRKLLSVSNLIIVEHEHSSPEFRR